MFHKVYNKKQTYAYFVYKQFRNSLNRTIKIAKTLIMRNYSILIKTIQRNCGRL